MVAFSRLPDACQLAIFKQLPPQDQLLGRTVCRKWDTLIPVAASTRRSLILILGVFEFPLECFDFESLQPFITIEKPEMRLLTKEDGSPVFPPEDEATIWNSIYSILNLQENCHLIASTFTGISTLKVILTIERSEHLTTITMLLQLWHHQLTTFQLIEFYPSTVIILSERYHSLYTAINSLSYLKRLLLYLNRLPQADLSVISHLEELDIIINPFRGPDDDQNHFMKMLQKYGESNQDLARVGYTYAADSPNGYEHICEPFTSLDGHLRQVFTRLEVTDYICSHNLSTMCNQYRGLMSLKVHFIIESYGLVTLFYELSKLKQLIYLSLAFRVNELPLPNAHHRLEQLPSVKALFLKLSLPTPQHMAALDIGWIFPNLQVITLKPVGGDFFNPAFLNEDYAPRGTLQSAKEYLRQLFRLLKRRFGRQLIIRHPFRNICPAEELLAAM